MEPKLSEWHLIKPDTTQVRILVCSDTHANVEAMSKFFKHYSDKHLSHDLILMPGDFSCITEHSSVSENEKAEKEAQSTLTAYVEHTKLPILFIPGNHEANSLYTHAMSVPAHTLNLHQRTLQLDEKLCIIGYGGAPPGIEDKGGVWHELWEGYPLETDAEFSKELCGLVDGVLAKQPDDMQYILLTHAGPWAVHTAMTPLGAQCGSKGLAEVLDKYNKRILCNVHGHTHASPGMAKRYYVAKSGEKFVVAVN